MDGHQLAEELTAHDAFAAHVDAELGIDPNAVTNPRHDHNFPAIAFTVGSMQSCPSGARDGPRRWPVSSPAPHWPRPSHTASANPWSCRHLSSPGKTSPVTPHDARSNTMTSSNLHRHQDAGAQPSCSRRVGCARSLGPLSPATTSPSR